MGRHYLKISGLSNPFVRILMYVASPLLHHGGITYPWQAAYNQYVQHISAAMLHQVACANTEKGRHVPILA